VAAFFPCIITKFFDELRFGTRFSYPKSSHRLCVVRLSNPFVYFSRPQIIPRLGIRRNIQPSLFSGSGLE
jgi:hypothetical protein